MIVEHRGATLAKFGFPGRSFSGLQAVFALHLHEHAILLHSIKQAGKLLSELRAAGNQIFTEQISQVFRFGANTEVGSVLAGQLVDQKNQGTDATAQEAVGFGLLLFNDLLKPLLHLAGADEIVGNLIVEKVAGHNSAQFGISVGAAGLMHHAELGAHLGRCAGGIHGMQHTLPEPAPNGQQRIIRKVDEIIL